MSLSVELSHVTLLVPSLERSIALLPANIYNIWPIDAFEEKDDGKNREVYVGPAEYAKGMLLFMQSITSRCLSLFAQRYGYGLHHIGIDVPNVVKYCDAMNEKGWYLHVTSAYAIKHMHTAYLVRPGVPLIIEVHEVEHTSKDYFINKVIVEVNNSDDEQAILNLGIRELHPQIGGKSSFQIGDKTWEVAAITNE